MILKRLSILNYKNIRQAEVAFSPKMNCFFGNNGMGKTNLLDAIHYLSFCKSYLNTPESLLVTTDEELCVLQGAYLYEGRDEDIFCSIRRKSRKQFKRNKKEYDKLSDHIGLLPLVMVSPADSELIQGGSDERRKFLDMIISQQDKNYLHALIQYNKALMQRNVLLKNQVTDYSLFEVLEMQMELYGSKIYKDRVRLVEELTPLFNSYYQTICSSSECVGLTYISQLSDCGLAELLQQSRERDRYLGYTSSGVHKDDLEMTLSGQLIRRVGSQGQNKTFLIALKLAQFALLAKKGRAKVSVRFLLPTPTVNTSTRYWRRWIMRIVCLKWNRVRCALWKRIMKRNNSQKLGELLRDFFEDNTELYEKMMEIRIRRAWQEVLGPMVLQYTRNVYVKDRVLYVSLTSSVLRSELVLCREKLVKSLNDYAGSQVIRDIVIR